MKMYCIADEDTVRGFRLAGVLGRAVPRLEDAAVRERAQYSDREQVQYLALDWALSQPDCGLLILTEDVRNGLGAKLDGLRTERNRPIIVEIPGPGGPKTDRESLRQLVQRAVGTSLEKEP